MFRHIAVAVDFSSATDAILRCLPGLRELGARQLTFVHVARLESPVTGWVTHLEYYERKLEELRPAMEREGFEVGIAVVAGTPAAEIVRIAQERGASLVLVGSRGSNSVLGGFVGSVAWGVAQRAPLPVLVLRVEPSAGEPGAPLVAACCDLHSHVLYPTDFSDAAQHAFHHVEALARAGLRSFTLLHVREDVDEPWVASEVVREQTRRLEDLAERLRAAGAAQVEVGVPTGRPLDELLRFTAERRDTLVVLGTHGRGWLAKMVVGSVSHDILRRAGASMLLVRLPAAGGAAAGGQPGDPGAA